MLVLLEQPLGIGHNHLHVVCFLDLGLRDPRTRGRRSLVVADLTPPLQTNSTRLADGQGDCIGTL